MEKTIIATMELTAFEWFEFMAFKKQLSRFGISYTTKGDHYRESENTYVKFLDESETVNEIKKSHDEKINEIDKLFRDPKYYEQERKKYLFLP